MLLMAEILLLAPKYLKQPRNMNINPMQINKLPTTIHMIFGPSSSSSPFPSDSVDVNNVLSNAVYLFQVV